MFVFLILIVPAFSLAQTSTDTDQPDPDFVAGKSLIPCGHAVAGVVNNPCSFNDALTLINAVIRFILFSMVIPIAAVMFFYAGFLMVTSGGSSESKTKAKNIFTNTVFGVVFAVGAWLIIRTLLSVLGYNVAWIFDKF